jgi:pilus assembly protein CpaB
MPDKSDTATPLYRAAVPPRRSALRLVGFVGVSVGAAIASALLLTRYMDRRAAEVRVPTRPVVVATVELPVGTELRAENLAVVEWPASGVPDGTFPSTKELEGRLVATRVYAREPLLAAKLAGAGNAGLSALLQPGMRAAAVRVDDVVGVAGFVKPGDSVDVIATIRTEGSGPPVTTAKVILQNVKVLAVGRELDAKTRPDKVVQATVATLMVDPVQSERLALAAAQGKILLTLRSDADVDVVATGGVNAARLLNVQEPDAKPSAAHPAPHVARGGRVLARTVATEKPAGEVVEILRGDVFEKRKFEGKAP